MPAKKTTKNIKEKIAKNGNLIFIAVVSLIGLGACSLPERLSGSSLAMQSVENRALASSRTKNVRNETITNSNSFSKSSGKSSDQASGQSDEYVLTTEMERRAGITVTPVILRQLKKTAVFSSSVEATSRGSAVVNSLVHGIITRVLADVGESVKAGQILCYINCPDLLEAQSNYLTSRAKMQEANAQIIQVRNRLELAKADVERFKQLNKEGIAATKELQSSLGRLATTEAELASAKSLQSASRSYVAAAQLRLKSFGILASSVEDNNLINELPLHSPISGVIVKKSISPGQNVNPAAGSGNVATNSEDGLFSIVDLSKVWVMLEVPQSEVADLKVGAPIDFKSEVDPGKLFKGKVIVPGEKFDPASRTVAVRVEINNPQGILKPGMMVLANAVENVTSQAVAVVPNAALQNIGNQAFVFVKESEHRYRKYPVSTGRTNGQFTQISGVRPGQSVVTQGSFILKSEALKENLGPHD